MFKLIPVVSGATTTTTDDEDIANNINNNNTNDHEINNDDGYNTTDDDENKDCGAPTRRDARQHQFQNQIGQLLPEAKTPSEFRCRFTKFF